jgi:simple sugar transport system ATP-binding protein
MGVELRDIHKHFGAIRANDGISLEVEAGTLHGLLGENGAGKSTLMKVLSGYHPADSGDILIDGVAVSLGSPDEAIAAGVGMLHQDPLVFLPMTVLENFMLGVPRAKAADRRTAGRDLADGAAQFGFSFDPEAPVRTLTVGERQQLEIVRLLWLGAKVLILDEPTTGISAPQRVQLFAALRTLAKAGMSVIFVSHKLEEIADLCDSVTVMRRGKVVGAAEMPVPESRLVEMMFGAQVEIPPRTKAVLGEPVLVCHGVGLDDRLITVRNLDLEVRAGEVVGLAGMEGSGQRSLLRACAGLHKLAEGTISLAGLDAASSTYRDLLAHGLGYLPAGRLEEGLVRGLTVAEHVAAVDAATPFFVDWDDVATRAEAAIASHDIKGTPDSPAEALSGGNQQRLLLAMLQPRLKLLLMEHPTRGLDLESAAWIWEQLLDRRKDGTAIMFASADIDELLAYCDRIVVLFAGEVMAVLDAATATVEQIGFLIGGRKAS